MLEVTQQVELVLEPEAPDAQTQHHTWHTVSLNLSQAAPKPQLPYIHYSPLNPPARG